MAYDPLNPVVSAPITVVTVAKIASVSAAALTQSAGTLIYVADDATNPLYICLPDFAVPSVMKAYEVAATMTPA